MGIYFLPHRIQRTSKLDYPIPTGSNVHNSITTYTQTSTTFCPFPQSLKLYQDKFWWWFIMEDVFSPAHVYIRLCLIRSQALRIIISNQGYVCRLVLMNDSWESEPSESGTRQRTLMMSPRPLRNQKKRSQRSDVKIENKNNVPFLYQLSFCVIVTISFFYICSFWNNIVRPP